MKKFMLILITLGAALYPANARSTGFYIEGGPIGVVEIYSHARDFSAGPGFQVRTGYDWDHFGLRTKFIVSTHDDEQFEVPQDDSVEMVSWTIDGKILLLEAPFRPYLFGGGGAYFLTEGSLADNDDASGVGGNVGFGFEYGVTDYLGLGLENGFHFVAFVADEPEKSAFFDNAHNGFAVYFYTIAGTLTYHF